MSECTLRAQYQRAGVFSKALENVNQFVPGRSRGAVQTLDSSRCFPLQSAAAAINAGGHIWPPDSRGSSLPHTALSVHVCVCVRVGLSASRTQPMEACKYSSQLSPPAPVWQEAAGIQIQIERGASVRIQMLSTEGTVARAHTHTPSRVRDAGTSSLQTNPMHVCSAVETETRQKVYCLNMINPRCVP